VADLNRVLGRSGVLNEEKSSGIDHAAAIWERVFANTREAHSIIRLLKQTHQEIQKTHAYIEQADWSAGEETYYQQKVDKLSPKKNRKYKRNLGKLANSRASHVKASQDLKKVFESLKEGSDHRNQPMNHLVDHLYSHLSTLASGYTEAFDEIEEPYKNSRYSMNSLSSTGSRRSSRSSSRWSHLSSRSLNSQQFPSTSFSESENRFED
jgi:DNA repair ATPase RecN